MDARVRRRLRLLVALGVVASALAVFAVVETLHYSSANGSGGGGSVSAGFFVPKSTTPVSFSLAPVSGHGATVSFASLAGMPVVVNLWASDCSVCKTETPAIESVARADGDRVHFVGVDTLDTRSAALSFLGKYGVTYPELFDEKAVVATGYGASVLPVTIFVSAGGKVVGENIGALTATSLDHHLSTLFGI